VIVHVAAFRKEGGKKGKKRLRLLAHAVNLPSWKERGPCQGQTLSRGKKGGERGNKTTFGRKGKVFLFEKGEV